MAFGQVQALTNSLARQSNILLRHFRCWHSSSAWRLRKNIGKTRFALFRLTHEHRQRGGVQSCHSLMTMSCERHQTMTTRRIIFRSVAANLINFSSFTWRREVSPAMMSTEFIISLSHTRRIGCCSTPRMYNTYECEWKCECLDKCRPRFCRGSDVVEPARCLIKTIQTLQILHDFTTVLEMATRRVRDAESGAFRCGFP